MIKSAQSILVVEDSDDDFEATTRAFRKTSLRNPVIRAESGDEALTLLCSQGMRPGLILLDLNLPGISGNSVLERIKSDSQLKKIPVIVLTTSTDERDIEQCYSLGANTYIQKPVDLQGFFAAIQRLQEYWFEIAVLPKEE